MLIRSLAVISAMTAAAAAFAADKDAVVLNVGDEAPAFTLKDDQGNDWNSADHFGKKTVVVYFYPADETGGCTKQACGYRDNLSKLAGEDVEVVGISGDSVRNHQLFKKHHNLTFTLLADENGDVARMFGVPVKEGVQTVEAEIDGQKEQLTRKVTTQRWTFVVDKNGRISMKNAMVKAADDSQAILDFLGENKKTGNRL